MSSGTDIREFYRGDFQRLRSVLPGAAVPWLQSWRLSAFEQFMESGFPTTRNEEWKYTDVRLIASRRFIPMAVSGQAVSAVSPLALDGPTLVFVDGHYSTMLSVPGGLPDGVHITSIARALSKEPGAVEPWLRRRAALSRHGFSALNAAFMQDGAYIHISRGVEVEAPIQLLFVSTGVPDSGAYVRNIIVAEAGSRATVVENYAGSGSAVCLTNAVTEAVLEDGAALEHYRLVRDGTGYHIGNTEVRQGADSRYRSHSVTTGGHITRHELNCALESEGAECRLNGLYAGNDRQHMDHSTRVDHRVARCTSREWYRGVLDQAARGIFSGRVVVHPRAQHTDAEQANHNLLLSENAEADSRPQFEIYADDVKCAHGTTTGSLDPEALFYLRTRGLEDGLARQLLIYAFVSDILARMRLAPVRVALEDDLAARWLRQESIRELVA